jgi:hypothetical protein
MEHNITISRTREEAERVAAWFRGMGVPTEVEYRPLFDWWAINTTPEWAERARDINSEACAIVNLVTGRTIRPAAWA